MPSSGPLEWERPNPDVEVDSDEIIIPRVPYDDDNPPDLEDTDNDDVDEEEEEERN